MTAGTSTYIVGAALSTVWNKYCPFTVTQQPMQVTGPAFRLIKNGSLDLGITTVWAINGCYTGKDPFWDMWVMKDFAPVAITQIASGSMLRYGVFTTNPKIKTLKDLEGRRMYITQPGAENDIQVKALFQAAGVDYKKVKDVSFSQMPEAVQGLKEGRAEAFYYTLSTWVEDMTRTKQLYLVDIPADVPQKMNQQMPGWGFLPATIKDGEYGLGKGGVAIGVPMAIYARGALSEDAVYSMTKNMYEHHDELVAIHATFLSPWTLDNALLAIGAPIHPGAVKYYKEKGIWTAAMESQNQMWIKYAQRKP
jgi:TRAP transporter TAXI family solute receptor